MLAVTFFDPSPAGSRGEFQTSKLSNWSALWVRWLKIRLQLAGPQVNPKASLLPCFLRENKKKHVSVLLLEAILNNHLGYKSKTL